MHYILCSLILSPHFCQVEAVVDKAYKNFSDKLSDALKVRTFCYTLSYSRYPLIVQPQLGDMLLDLSCFLLLISGVMAVKEIYFWRVLYKADVNHDLFSR